MKKAIILAAGVGKRLGELTREIPKCLLPIDSDNVLLDYSLEALKDNDVNEVIFVTGFQEDKLKEHINKKWKNKFLFKFIFNEKYSDYNNVYSAFLAKDTWDDEAILLNSDIIFHPGILRVIASKAKQSHKPDNECEIASSDKALLAMTHEAQSFLVIDDTKKLVAEDMKVTLNKKGEIKEINKSLDIKTSYGEYIGITYLRGKERIKFLNSLEKNIKNKNLDIYYEDALAQVLNEISVFPCSTLGFPWTEIDTMKDYIIAKQIANQIIILKDLTVYPSNPIKRKGLAEGSSSLS